jgi:hypothetical protein
MPVIDPFETENIVDPFEPVISDPFDGTETTMGGIAKSLGAGIGAGFTAPVRFVGAGLEVVEDITGIDLPGQTLTDISSKAQEWWQKRIGKSKAERLIGQATETIGTIASTAAVSPVSLLASLAAGAGLEKTAEALREGTPRLNAWGAGIATAATEYLTEKIPIGILQKPGLSFFKRLVGGAISDVPGELIATATEISVIDKQILGKDRHLTTDQYIDILKETAAVSILSTIGLSGGAQVLDMAVLDGLNKIKPVKPSEPHISKEKVEVIPEQALDREDSKSAYPELSKQDNLVIQDSDLELKPTTIDVPDQTVVDPIEKPKTTWQETMDKSRAESLKKRKLTKDKVWKSFVRGFVDVSGNLQKKLSALGNDGKRVVMRQNAIAGASTKGTKEANIAKKPIFDGLNTEQKQLFDDYISALRHLELRQNKGSGFILPENHTEQSLNDFINSVPENLIEQFQQRSEVWSQKMGEILLLMEGEGLLTADQVTRLRAEGKYYVPRQVLDFIDPEIQRKNREGKTITTRDSGLKNLTEDGSDKLIETDSELLLEQAYQRAYTRVFKNRAGLEMLRLARTDPAMQGIAREAKVVGRTRQAFEIRNKDTGQIITDEAFETRKEAQEQIKGLKELGENFEIVTTKFGAPVFEQAKPNEMKVSVMEDGTRRELIMPLELGTEWVTGDPILSATQANIIAWSSGNKILKAMATTLNPEFAITNVPRDLAHIWLTTEEYSSFAPVAALQMAGDILAVAKDAFTKSGSYDTYIDNGGGMEFLAHQGKLGLKGTNAVTKGMSGLEAIMSKAGEFSETVTRLALMRRAMRNKKTPFEATQIARGYLDFARGGSVSKALNSAIPFFNAGVQATRGIAEAAKKNPKTFGTKVFQIGAMGFGLAMANLKLYGDDYDDVPDFERKNNWIILTPLTFLDKNGEQRRRYIKIPKDQGQRVFASIFENMALRSEGRQVDHLSIVDEVNNFLPIMPGELMPPAVEMLLGYSVNKDFWTKEDIWRGEDVIPQEEYNKYTPETYVQLGKVTGLSPVRLQYMSRQLFTRGNIWTSLVGYGSEEIFKVLSPEERERVSNQILEQQPFVRRLMKSTRPDLRREKEIKREKIQIDTERLRMNRGLDALAERYFNGQTDVREVNEFIKRQETVPDKRRLRNRFKNLRRLRGVTNRGFWFDLLDLPPEQRAVNYWNQWIQMDEAGRKELDRQSRRVPGFRSKRFNRTFIKMRRFGEKGGR